MKFSRKWAELVMQIQQNRKRPTIVMDIYKVFFVLCICLFMFSGCKFMRGTTLKHITPFRNTMFKRTDFIDKKVWLSKVKILDPSVSDKEITEESLSINIIEYIRERKSFREVNFLPGKVGENDLILKFQFDKYEIRNYSGKLIIEDSHGSLIAETKSRTDGQMCLFFCFYREIINNRTSLIETLLNKAITEINRRVNDNEI